MSFKPKTAKIDLTLDLTECLLENDPKDLIKAVKNPSADEYIKWADATLDKEFTDKSKMVDTKFAMKVIVEQVDYWYEKGNDWWTKRCSFPVIQEVLKFLTDEVITGKKK